MKIYKAMSPEDGRLYYDCGHKHKTKAAAGKCLLRLQSWRNGVVDTVWYYGRVVECETELEGEN